VDCLRRLAHDVRMRDAFALLTREFTDDQQWRNFIYAAWVAASACLRPVIISTAKTCN
jgi:hypothetical protein